MITDEQAEKAAEYMRDNASEYASARAAREYLQEFRKSKKALLMQEVDGAQHVRESYAYSRAVYLQLLKDLRTAIEEEERLKWMLKAAEVKIDIWRTEQATARNIDRTHR